MNCELCGKIFSTKGNLLKHQQTAKFCLKLRENMVVKFFICSGCEKHLSSNYRLHEHQKICKKYEECDKIRDLEKIIEQYKITVEDLKVRNRELEDKLIKLAMKSTGKITTNTTTNYVYQNFTPITDEKLKEATINFTKRHLELGGQGVARYALENTLKDNFVCTDITRCHSKYIDENGDLVIDPFSHTMARRVCESLIEPAEKINNDSKDTLSDRTSDNELIKAVLMNENVEDIKNASKGVDNSLTREFAKTICSSSVKKCP